MQPEETKPQAPFPVEPVPLELLEQARQTFDEDEFWEQVRQIEQTGGHQLEDFLEEIRQITRRK